MQTYRDPTPEKSIEVYKQSLAELCEVPLSDEEVEKTVVSCYGNMIVPACPKDRGARSFERMLYGDSMKFRQLRADTLLKIKAEDVNAACKRLSDAINEESHKSVFCSKSDNFAGNIVKIPL